MNGLNQSIFGNASYFQIPPLVFSHASLRALWLWKFSHGAGKVFESDREEWVSSFALGEVYYHRGGI